MKRGQLGFTLVELLVVIAIIAVLTTIGMTVFRNVQGGSRDAARRTDVDAIFKAFEANFDAATGAYPALQASWFAGGTIPDPPEGGVYPISYNSDNSGYEVCAALENHPGGACSSALATCYCRQSLIGKYIAAGASAAPSASPSAPVPSPSPSPSPASCDPSGSLATGRVGWWKFNEGTGSTVASTPVGITGNWSGTPGWTTPANAKLGTSAGNFNGTDNFIDLNHPAALNTGNAFSLAAWVYPTSLPGGVAVISEGWDGGRVQYSLGFSIDEYGTSVSSRAFVGFYDGGTWRIAKDSATIPLNTWSLMVGTWDGTTMKVWRNVSGSMSQVASTTPGGSTSADVDPIYIGRRHKPDEPSPTLNYFPGRIDDVRIYNRALPQADVDKIFNSGNGCDL